MTTTHNTDSNNNNETLIVSPTNSCMAVVLFDETDSLPLVPLPTIEGARTNMSSWDILNQIRKEIEPKAVALWDAYDDLMCPLGGPRRKNHVSHVED